jgi:SAM-dependent methyltransferase
MKWLPRLSMVGDANSIVCSRRKKAAKAFDAMYARRLGQRLLDRIDQSSLHEPVVRNWGSTAFIAPGEPAELCREIRNGFKLAASEFTILDLGCGAGGAARYVSKELNAAVCGIDFSQVALRTGGACTDADFIGVAAEFEALPIRDSSFHAAFSLDALYLSSDIRGALGEVARVLVRGAPFIFTFYCKKAERKRVVDRWKLALAGVDFHGKYWSDRSAQWRKIMRDKHEKRLRKAALLVAADGPSIKPELQVSSAMLGWSGQRSFLSDNCRMWCVATKRLELVP